MHTFTLSRRRFGTALAGAAGLALLPRVAFGQAATRTVTTSLGTYDIPADPQRVICIDSRLDLEPAVALGLPVIAHGYGMPTPWVPSDPDWVFVGAQINLEQVLALGPDLIICTDVGDHDSDWWPINRLREVAPVLPLDYTTPWKQNLAALGEWTGREGQSTALLAEYDALIADIRARRGDLIASKRIAVVQPVDENLVYYQTTPDMMHIRVLTDLGALLPEPMVAPEHHIVAENFDAFFGEADALLYVVLSEGAEQATEANPLWARLPAVVAGMTLKPVGNINFGGIYTALHVARLIDDLYGKLAEA